MVICDQQEVVVRAVEGRALAGLAVRRGGLRPVGLAFRRGAPRREVVVAGDLLLHHHAVRAASALARVEGVRPVLPARPGHGRPRALAPGHLPQTVCAELLARRAAELGLEQNLQSRVMSNCNTLRRCTVTLVSG